MYRKAVSAHSMTTRGVRQSHLMPPQNIREPPPCCTRWTLFEDVQPDQVASKHESDDCLVKGICETHRRRKRDCNSEGSIQHVVGPIFTALHGVEVANMALAMVFGSEVEQHAAYCAQLGS